MKRGISHIEVVLSFLIFAVAVGFALFFFSPANSTRLIETTLDYTFREISDRTGTTLEIYSVIVNGSNPDIPLPPHLNTITIEIRGICEKEYNY